ncbi:MAG: hypothetical protein J6S51_02025 [Kiritimatiellae bacterium]|nr:hypothetical protein [Kiritimatiellia bacterium]
MKLLLSFVSVFFVASSVLAEPTAAQYFAQKETTDSGYTQTLLLPDGTLEYVVAFTTVNDESNPHTWQVPANVKDSKIDYLVVAGGGGGGTGNNASSGGGGGGGGGGGMLTGTLNSISESTDLTIVVGAGGGGGSSANKVANNGEDSFIKGATDIIAIGGGAGGSAYSQDVANGSAGGSGGGAAGTSGSSAKLPTTGGTCVEGQGFAGGNRTSDTTQNRPGAGGGGAGMAGITITTANTNNRGHGGDGRYSYITGAQVRYAGGGGGGTYGNSIDNNGLGGAGGGGAGGNISNEPVGNGGSGTASTGGGGGGARGYRSGGSGDSGIVVLRYALNNDNFQGIAVDSTTEKFGTPSPAYDIYKELPSNSAFTCPKYTVLSEGARATCIGWELYGRNEEGEEYLIRSDTFDSENPPYEETDLSKTITFTRNDSEKGVILKWKFEKEYYVSTVASCERGSLVADKSGWYRAGDTIQVAITSMDNFIGWGGWGINADRSIEPSKTIEVVAAPMTITAYFTAHNKDNLVLNGDFEMSGNTSDSTTIDTTFSRLIGGIWESTQNSYTSYPTGLLSARSTGVANSGSKVISGNHSGIIGTKGKNTNYSGTASISCYVNIPCSGLYDLSFDADPGDVNATTWEISVYLQKNGSGEEVNVCNILQKDNASKANYPFEIQIRKGGIYKLIFKIERSKVYKNDVNDNVNAHSAIDNLMLKLKKRFGFALMVR